MVVYSSVIFQEGVVEVIHIISHASEIFSNNFAFHQHGNGKFHVHHHGFMNTVKSLLQHDQQQEHDDAEIPVPQQPVKLHLPAFLSSSWSYGPEIDLSYFIFNLEMEGRLPDVLTPPPERLLYSF